MIAKSLIAAAAVAATMAVALPASQAEAKTNVDINIGFGVGGYYPGYYGYGYGPAYNPKPNYISCKRGRNIVDNSGFHNVSAIDCSLPSYKYVAWKKGHKFVVSVNRYGNIYNVNKVF